MRQRDADGGEEPDDQQAVDDHVGAAQAVGLAGRQRGERAQQVGDHDDADVEGEAHVEAGQDVRRDPGLRVVHVVEDDGGQHGQRQVAQRRAPCGYSSMVWSKKNRPIGLRTVGCPAGAVDCCSRTHEITPPLECPASASNLARSGSGQH